MDPYIAPANSEACGFTPPTTLGMSRRATVVLPGSSRWGENATKKFLSVDESPRAAFRPFLFSFRESEPSPLPWCLGRLYFRGPPTGRAGDAAQWREWCR